MKKIIILITLTWLVHFSVNAQANYVLNPGFEQYSQCPTTADQIKFAYYWSSIDSPQTYQFANDGEPEYINTCDTVSTSSVKCPSGQWFDHYPRTGSGMALVLMYTNWGYYPYVVDYLQGHLYKSLTAGKSYCVSFYVALGQSSEYSINHIGAYLDNGSVDTTVVPGQPQTEYTPQILETEVISDTLNWTKIEGSFVANGTERFITIGVFSDSSHTVHNERGLNTNGWAYYIVDDISVVESDLPAFAGNDTAIGKGDTILIGRNEEALDCKWYVAGNLIDSGAGIKVHPDTTTTYVVQQTVCGLVKYDTVVVTVWPLGVRDVSNNSNFSIYPNPNNGSFTMSSPGLSKGEEIRLQIFNALGQMVYQQKTKSQQQVHTDLASGVYLLQLTDDNGERAMQRLVISK